MRPFRILEHGIVHDPTGRPEAERMAFFPDLCLTASGALFSTFQIGRVKNAADSTLGIRRSLDRGRTWEEMPHSFERSFGGVAGSLSSGHMVETGPGRLLLIATWFDRADPDRPMFDPATEGLLRAKLLKSSSADNGMSWSPWDEIRIPGMDYSPHGSGPIVAWADGSFGLPMESHKAFDDPDPNRRDVQASRLIVSRDQGRSFGPAHLIAQDPGHTTYYWDQRLCPGREPGEFIALFWTHDRSQGRDIAVHLRRGRVSGGSVETGPIVDTGMAGQIAAPIALPDGKLLALVVNRERPGTIEAWQSDGDDRRWAKLGPIYTHSGGSNSAYPGGASVVYAEVWETLAKWRFGHPAVKALDGKEGLITYYAGDEKHLSIRWVRVELPA